MVSSSMQNNKSGTRQQVKATELKIENKDTMRSCEVDQNLLDIIDGMTSHRVAHGFDPSNHCASFLRGIPRSYVQDRYGD